MGSSFEKLVEMFGRFPGIGPRQAKRFVYFLLSQNGAFSAELASELHSLRKEASRCEMCQRFFRGTKKLCSICDNPGRDHSLLLVVEKDVDLDAVERTGIYKGLYFVLGGILPLLEKAPEEKIRKIALTSLVKGQMSKNSLKEIVLALSATPDGDHTAEYVKSLLAPIVKAVPIHILGRGLSTGSELEYADHETLRSAFAGRK